MTIAVAVSQQPQDACSCVAMFSHSTLPAYAARAMGKSPILGEEILSQNRNNRLRRSRCNCICVRADGFKISYLKPRLSFGPLLFPALIEGVANRRDEFFVVKRLHEKGDWPDGHCGGTRGQILSRGNDNYASLG